MATKNPTVTEYAGKLEVELEKIFVDKLPALPENVKEIIVKISPWFAVLSMILLAPIILGAFGLSALLMPVSFLGGYRLGIGGILTIVFSVGMIILQLLAIPGLFKRQAKAWQYMFYAIMLSAVESLLAFNLGGLIIGGAISCYFLFQVKDKYTK